MRKIRFTMQTAMVVALLMVAVGGVIWWQAIISPQPNTEPTEPLGPPTPQPAAETGDSAAITLAVESYNRSLYEPLVAAFEQENPHIQVRLASTDEVANPDDDEPVRALASSFDVFPYSPNRQGETQYLLDLRPFLDLDPQFDTVDFLPGLLPKAPAPLWAIPTGAAYYLTFYDQTAFAAAGLAAPALEWTKDDFLAAAVALTVREGDEVTRWGYVPGQLRYPPLLSAQLAGPLATADGLRLDDPDVVSTVQWFGELFTVHEVAPWLDEYRPAERRSGGGPSSAALIAEGQAAMWHTTHVLYDESEAHVGVTAVPREPNGYAADPILYGFAVSRGTGHPEAAWQLLHFLSRQPPQEALLPWLTPARPSVAAATGYWDRLPEKLVLPLQYAAENNIAPRLSAATANLLAEAFAAHIDDNRRVAAVLEELATTGATPPRPEEAEIVVVTEAEPGKDEETIQITFATSFGIMESHRRLANQFGEDNPDIDVRIVERDEYASEPLNQVTTSDCFLGHADHWQDEDVRAALLSLDAFLELDNTLQIDDFYPILVEPLVIEGELWGIPAFGIAPFLDYNRQIFEEAGIPPPSPDWTLDDFLEVAQQLTTGEGGEKQYGYAEIQDLLYLGFTSSFGVDVVDDSAGVPTFDFAAATEMVTWHADLIRLYGVQPLLSDESVSQLYEFEALVREGKVAMWPGGYAASLVVGRHDIPLPFEVGAAALPIGSSGYRGELWSSAYHILADSPHREACWEWIKFLSMEPTAVQARNTTARMLPAHIETAESDAFISMVGEDLAEILHVPMNDTPSAEATIISPTPEWMRPGFEWLRHAYREAAAGETDVPTALANADAKFSQYRQCVIEQDAFENYAGWRGCALEVDPGLIWRIAEPTD